MSDLVLLSIIDLPPVVLVLLSQSFRIRHVSADTQLGGAYEPVRLDGFLSPHLVMQICH